MAGVVQCERTTYIRQFQTYSEKLPQGVALRIYNRYKLERLVFLETAINEP